MKRIALVLALCFGTAYAWAEGAKFTQPSAVYQDDGDAPIPVVVTCGTTSWGTVVSSDSIRRSILIQGVRSNQYDTCLSTSSSLGACADTIPGLEIATQNYIGVSLFTKGAIYCRAKTAAQYLKAWIGRDSADQGRVR